MAAVLSELQRDALKEVGNIGAGHAATAFSQLLNTKVGLSESRIDVLKFRDLATRVGVNGTTFAALRMDVKSSAPGQMLVLFERDNAVEFVTSFMQRVIGNVEMFQSIIDSTIKEFGNILAGSYLTALTQLTGIDMIPSVPKLVYGTAQVALDELFDVPSDHDVFLVESSFLDQGKTISGQFVLIPEGAGSIDQILAVFGV